MKLLLITLTIFAIRSINGQAFLNLSSEPTLNGQASSTFQYGVASVYANGNHYQWYSCGYASGSTHTYGICLTLNGVPRGRVLLNTNFGLCDVADPSVIQLGGIWYMYATGIPIGNSGCQPGLNNRIYAFTSTDGVNWSLPSPNPVITIGDVGDYAVGQPAAVVLNYFNTCQSAWSPAYPIGFNYFYYTANPSSPPRVRIYYSEFAPSLPNFPYHMYAQDSFDGLHFGPIARVTDGSQNVLSPNLNLFSGPWPGGTWRPGLAKLGWNGDYPLVTSSTGDNYTWSEATTTIPDSFDWITNGSGSNGYYIQFSVSGASSLQFDRSPDGTLLDVNQNPINTTGTQQLKTYTSAGSGLNLTIYSATTSFASLFPNLSAGTVQAYPSVSPIGCGQVLNYTP